LPVRVLSRLFRRLFLRDLQNAFDTGNLRFFGKLSDLSDPEVFARRLDALRHTNWVVFAKPPFGGPEQVLAYLGRYTHRVAIANSRLISLSDGKVRFTWKDYRQDGKTKMMTLEADEFIRRFLLHTLPDGFHRIRHYGFLANGGRRDHLGLCRRLLAIDNASAWSKPANDPAKGDCSFTAIDFAICPECGGTMHRIAAVPLRDKGQQHLPGDEAWLIGEYRVLGEMKYYLANLSAKTDLRTLAATIKARWICEQAHQQLKEELGLDHFEGRSWQGLHRHTLMTMIAYVFLQHRRLKTARREKKNQWATASTDIARSAPSHRRTNRSATTAAMPVLQKMDLRRKAA
jgi:hypothetical protein